MAQTQTPRLNLKNNSSVNILWNIGTVILAFSIITVILLRTYSDPDLWGHLRFGLDTLHAGKIIQVDSYSYLTSGQRWINHEWLSQVLFALAWTAMGAPGLVLLKMTIGFLTFASLYWYLRSLKLEHIQAAFLLLLLGIPLLYLFFSFVRPQIFTYLFFTLLLIIIRKAEYGEYRWLWAAPLLLVFWANLHGGFLAGVGLLCLWAILHLAFHRHAWAQIIPPTLASIAATIINPYGLDLLIFLLRTSIVQKPEITEWQPLQLVSIEGLIYLLILIMSFYWLSCSSQPRRPILFFLLGITVLLPWVAVRHLPLFYIASLIFISEHVGSTWNRAKPQKKRTRPFSAWIASLPTVLAAVILMVGYMLNPLRIQLVIEKEFPTAVVALLKQSGVSGNLANDYDWGEYLIWQLGPQIKVSMDGRERHIYSTSIYQQNLNFMSGNNDWDALLKQHRTDMALVKKQAPDYNLLMLKPGWMMVFEDSNSALFVNQDSSLLEPLRQAVANFEPPKANGYFP